MKQNYSLDIIKFNHKHPLLATIGKQVLFWIIAFNLLFFIMHHHTLSVFAALGTTFEVRMAPFVLFIIFLGGFFGVALGLLDYFMKRIYHRNHSMGINILIGSGMYFLVVMALLSFSRFIVQILAEGMFLDEALKALLSDANWKHFNLILMGYTFFMTLVISFIGQMNQKFGPGYMLPILFGRFRYPREEERIFMFLDLTSSTKLAEQLEHLKYSALIQDCFMDINKVVRKYNAEIYQYVGDEVVVSWPREGLKNYACTEFFFAVQERLLSRKAHYMKTYGLLPSFKAGLHMGVVTMVEVGDVKRDIAYHGDTLNVAARLEGLCNETQQPILVSGAVMKAGQLEQKYTTTPIGSKKLQGRKTPVEIFGIAPKVTESSFAEHKTQNMEKMMNTQRVMRTAVLALMAFFITTLGFSQFQIVEEKDSLPSTLSLLKYDGLSAWGGFKHTYTRPLQWQKDDFMVAGAILLGTGALYLLDDEANTWFADQEPHIPGVVKDFGWYYGSPQNNYALNGAVYLYGLFTKNEKIRKTGVLLITAASAAGLIQTFSKTITGRARPTAGEGPGSFEPFSSEGKYHSFPSGHTILSFTTAYAIGKQFKNPWIKGGIYALGMVAPVSRLWAGAHWLSDVGLSMAISVVVVDAIDNYLNKERDYGQPNKDKISWNFQVGLGRVGLTGTF